MIGGTSSGCGKTTFFCALAQAFVNRGKKVSSFKCGPDYIDPMFHKEVIGAQGANLDRFFSGELLRYSFADAAKELSLIEGVMGFYDGEDFTLRGSSCSIAQELKTSSVLVVDGRGSALSVFAVMQGFLNFAPNNTIRGFLLTRVAESTYQSLSKLAENFLPKGVKLYGYLPKLPEDLILGSRHLGLVTASEVKDLQEKLARLAQICEQCVDLDGLEALAESAPPLSYTEPEIPSYPPITVAVARDEAFCFYYAENLKLLERMGAKIAAFSPMRDSAVPKDADALYFGGGYPELYADILSANSAMRESVLKAVQDKTPTVAECGGFLYLNKMLGDKPMAGVLRGTSEYTNSPVRFGYVTLTAKEDTLLLQKGDSLRGHEFHYFECSDSGSDYIVTRHDGQSYAAAFANEWMYAGFPHIHFYSNIRSAARFYEQCLKRKEQKVEDGCVKRSTEH